MGALDEAVRSGDMKRVRTELSRTPSSGEFQSALAAAVVTGRLPFVEILLESLASPDEPAPGEVWSPLRLAIEHDDQPIIRRLLLSPSDVNRADRFGSTPLMHAIDVAADAFHQSPRPNQTAPDTTVIRMLLDRGADPAAVGPDGKTALGIARDYEFVDAIALIESRLRRRDRRGRFGYVTEVGDFILERRAELGMLREVLARVFSVSPTEIRIVTRVEDMEAGALNVQVFPARGEFAQIVSTNAAREREPLDPFDALVTVSRELGTTLLAPQPGHDPYAYWKIEPSGEWDSVLVDDESEDPDETPIYRLMRIEVGS